MIDQAAILDRMRLCIIKQLGVDEDEIRLKTSFVDDLGADSLDQVEIIHSFEHEFRIEVPDKDVDKIKTVEQAWHYILLKLMA